MKNVGNVVIFVDIDEKGKPAISIESGLDLECTKATLKRCLQLLENNAFKSLDSSNK